VHSGTETVAGWGSAQTSAILCDGTFAVAAVGEALKKKSRVAKGEKSEAKTTFPLVETKIAEYACQKKNTSTSCEHNAMQRRATILLVAEAVEKFVQSELAK